jgi:CheY-like chemotaxis protein
MNEMIRIIIAEDNPNEQFFIRRGLENTGFQILRMVKNGVELVELLENCKTECLPDLILSDINMPLKNGIEALKEIKQNPALRHIPVVIYSTSDDDSTQKTCIEFGAQDYIVKPFSGTDYKVLGRKLRDRIK